MTKLLQQAEIEKLQIDNENCQLSIKIENYQKDMGNFCYIFNKIRYAADKWELAGRVHGAARVNGQAEWIGRESGWVGAWMCKESGRGRESGECRDSGSTNFLCLSADF